MRRSSWCDQRSVPIMLHGNATSSQAANPVPSTTQKRRSVASARRLTPTHAAITMETSEGMAKKRPPNAITHASGTPGNA